MSLFILASCKKKIAQPDCEKLIDRYATLVVTERDRDASATTIKSEQAAFRDEAKGDENFQSCESKITRAEFDCAMAASTADAFEKCLE
ncbi:MAG: hypothetical protein ABIP89_22380 [Polyangiaceae bacterium]